jgi:hypothetical protein
MDSACLYYGFFLPKEIRDGTAQLAFLMTPFDCTACREILARSGRRN